MKDRLKYRWVALAAAALWLFLVLVVVSGTATRKEFTFRHTFIPPAMILAALGPMSIRRIVTHRWFVPITATWICSATIAIHFIGTRLTGLGHQCDRVILVTSGLVWCALNIGWLARRLWRFKLTCSIQEAII